MATVTQERSDTLVEIEKLGFKATLVAQYDLTGIDPSRPIQVRESSHYSPKDSRQRFAVQMTLSVFDPIVVTRDRKIVDGNTRAEAKLAQKGGDHFFPAYVLDVEYSNCTERQKEDLHILAATLNCNGGEQLTQKERRLSAEVMITRGLSTAEISRRLGFAANSVSQVKKEIAAAERITRLSLNPNGDTRSASLRALGDDMVLGLTDAPYKELVVLAQKADLNATEIKDVAKEARATQSEAGALEVIQRVRGEMAERITEKDLTGRGKPPVSRQLRQHLGFIRQRSGREQELVETNPSVAPLHIEALTESIAILKEILRRQEAQRG